MKLTLETLTAALQQLALESPSELDSVIRTSCGDLYVSREKYNRLKAAYMDAKARISMNRANKAGSAIQHQQSRRLTTGTMDDRQLLRTSSDSGHRHSKKTLGYGQSMLRPDALARNNSARLSFTHREANNRLLPHIRPWTLIAGTPFLPPTSPDVALAGTTPESPRAVQTLRMIVIAQSAVRGWIVRRRMPSLPLARVTHEVVASERRYVAALKTCVDIWMRSFRKRPESTDGMTSAVFLQLEAIYLLQQTVLQALESTWVPHLEGHRRAVEYVLHKYVNAFRSYKAYVDGYTKAIETITKLHNKHPWFRNWRAECKYASNNEDLESFLIRPVQRLPRYALFLRQLESIAAAAPPTAQLPDMAVIRSKLEVVLQSVNRQGYQNPLALLPCTSARLYQTVTFPIQRVKHSGFVQRHAELTGAPLRLENVYVMNESLAVVVDGTIVEAYTAMEVLRCGRVAPSVAITGGKTGFWFVDTCTTYMLFFCEDTTNTSTWIDEITSLVQRD